MSERGPLEKFERFKQEASKKATLVYDPNFKRKAAASNGVPTPWKRNPDGSITVGEEEIEKAIMYADKMKSPDAKTAVGLSVKYIKEHFPRALKGTRYDE